MTMLMTKLTDDDDVDSGSWVVVVIVVIMMFVCLFSNDLPGGGAFEGGCG